MANDTPFVPLSTPPASATQPQKEVDIRGHDYSDGAADDEYLRAVAYREHLKTISLSKVQMLKLLQGSSTALKSLLDKTRARQASPPPYTDDP